MNRDSNPISLRYTELAVSHGSVHGTRKIIILLTILGLVYMNTTEAAFEAYKPADLVADSEVIVKAKMIGLTQIVLNNDHVIVLGVLSVDKVLKGEVTGDMVLLRLPGPEMEMRSDRIEYKKGQNGWWFLRGSENTSLQGIYTADHPQRFSDDQSTEQWLKNYL